MSEPRIGERYALRWPKAPHLVDVQVTGLEGNEVACSVVHRCPPTCDVPIASEVRYPERDFEKLFVPIVEAPALEAGHE